MPAKVGESKQKEAARKIWDYILDTETPIELSEEDEKAFQEWYKNYSDKLGLSSNPDDKLHYYNYRKAWKAGYDIDEAGHMPSFYKLPGHPTYEKKFISRDWEAYQFEREELD